MWFWKQLKKNDGNDDNEGQNLNFILEIISLSNININDNNIIIKIKSFIEAILLQIHYENQLDSEKNMKVRDIFFFELLSESKCKCKKNYKSNNYMLCLNIDQFKDKKLSIDYVLKESKMNFTCDICKQSNPTKFKFNKSPEILIIIFESKNNNINFKLNYESQISIKEKEHGKKELKYELISTIIRKEETNNKNEGLDQSKNKNNPREVESYIKSSIDKEWRRAGENIYIINKDVIFNNLNDREKKIFPYLLIYQKIKILLEKLFHLSNLQLTKNGKKLVKIFI
jgi:hypothetical protein